MNDPNTTPVEQCLRDMYAARVPHITLRGGPQLYAIQATDDFLRATLLRAADELTRLRAAQEQPCPNPS